MNSEDLDIDRMASRCKITKGEIEKALRDWRPPWEWEKLPDPPRTFEEAMERYNATFRGDRMRMEAVHHLMPFFKKSAG